MEKKCLSCNEIMKLIPAGTSKKTGRPYKAFYACKCGQTAPAYTNSRPLAQTPPKQPVLPQETGKADEFKEELRDRLDKQDRMLELIFKKIGGTIDELNLPF